VLTSPEPQAVPLLRGQVAGAQWLVTSRLGGVSVAPFDTWNLGGHVGDDPAAVAANRARLDRLVGHRVVFADQVHGREVAVVDPCSPNGSRASCDALVAPAGVAVGVLVADCVPVLLAAPDIGAVAAVHAGRRGVQLGVVAAAVARLGELGADAARLGAVVGPAVCAACYEVGGALRAEVAAAVPATWAVSASGTPALDLRSGVVAQLAEQGVGDVAVVGGCTRQTPELFSYRRSSATGRFAAVVWRDVPA